MSTDSDIVQDVDEAADRLYGAPSAGFTARRTELAGQARRAGLTALSKEIAGLRRPTVAAELVNLLVRAGQPEVAQQVDRLQTLGDQLRQAQADLDGDLMKQLTGQRHELVATLVRQTVELAAGTGQKVSTAVQRELEETLGAAVADEQALLAVTSGRLTRSLVYSGFGDVDVSAATATPLHRPPVHRPARAAPAARSETPEADVTARAQAQAAVEAERGREAAEAAQAARETLTSAEAELAGALEHQQTAHAHEDELANRLDELQRQILQTRHELDAASRKVAAADRDHQRQERQVRDARKAAWQAEQALIRTSPSPSPTEG